MISGQAHAQAVASNLGQGMEAHCPQVLAKTVSNVLGAFRILCACLALASLSPVTSWAGEDPWPVLHEGQGDKTCRAGIGWLGGVREPIIQTIDCAIIEIPHPEGVGWISRSARPSDGVTPWYKVRVRDHVTENKLANFLGQICVHVGAEGTVAEAKGNTVFFRCANSNPE
ncbi:hypothetical protein [Roseovarius sp. THAF27]|uniref:hypothetical protein n=1 Tax=Roseovarius sp. THAF27 TaxID=2587850 RepID=UPI001268D3D4|nr:hypothetical protein [Roseovarius sp. THAF27]